MSSLKHGLLAAMLLIAPSVQAEQLKVANIEALSGPGGEIGSLWAVGVKYGIEKLNAEGGFNGEPIKLTEYDNQSTPGGASDKLRAAVADGARIIFQAGSSAVTAQLSDDVRKYNLRNPGKEILFITNGSESYELTADKCHFWFFRLISNPYVRIKALVSVMKDQGVLGTKVYSINQNYSYGQEMQRAQAKFVTEAGGQIVEATLHDVAKIQDFSPYVAKIKASGAQSALSGNWGNDMVLLMKAVGNSGLKIQFGNTNLDNPGVIGSAGDAALGAYHAAPYSPEGGGAEGEKFVADFRARTGQMPTFNGNAGLGMGLLGDALKRAQTPNKTVDVTKIAYALETAKVQTPMGEMAVRAADHQGLVPIAISVVSKDAKYKSDGTQLGLKLVTIIPGAQAAVDVDPACKMQRPAL